MWLKLCLLLIYITVLFLLARLVEALTWYETGSLSRRLLDPMTLSVAKLKALLEQRGVSYDTVVEKGELTQFVEASGTVHEDEVELLQSSEDTEVSADTNFTSGTHFYEQVEDAKDSVWLVQVLANHINHAPFSPATWKSIRKKVTKFGINTGMLDCRLDPWWCENRGWHSSHLLLALPQVYKQKANVAAHTYEGPLRQNALSRWMRQKLQEKIETIQDFDMFKDDWLTFRNGWQESEVRALLFTDQDVIPMFFTALSVKFPGRVRFGVVDHNNKGSSSAKEWARALLPDTNFSLPMYLIVTREKAYVYGKNQGDCLTFSSMETLLKFLHPCLNDIFILSFLVANLVSSLELVVAQGRLCRRIRRLLWCVVKYNAAVIMLWLPLIAIFQLPCLNHFPLLGLKFSRVLATSSLGEALRRDIFYYSQHPYILAASFVAACTIFGIVAYKITGGHYEEDNEPWFNFAQMRTLTHLRSNEFFEPVSIGGYDLSGGMEIFGSRLSLPTMSLQPVVSPHYIHQLPTWSYQHAVRPSPNHHCQACSSSCHSVSSGSMRKITDNSAGDSLSDNLGSGQNVVAGQSSNSLPCGPCTAHLCSCTTASANDLLDGNYHCECQERQHGRFVNGSLLNQPSSLTKRQSMLTNITTPPVTESDDSFQSSTHYPSNSDNESKCSECGQHLGGRQNHTMASSTSSTTSSTIAAATGGYHIHDSARVSEFEPTRVENESADAAEFPDGFLVCSQCVICLEDFGAGVMLCGLPCGHAFHHSCILTWLKCDHHFCPICRWPSFRPRLDRSSHHAHAE